MNTLRLHYSGKTDFLKILKDKFILLKQSIFKNSDLTSLDKKEKLKEIKNQFQKEKQNSTKNLY